VRLLVGTSGYSYKEWKGSFYPEELPDAKMLSYYASRLLTVEINNTFYRMPTKELLLKWKGEVGAGFTFVLKAPQRLTHRKRLSDCADDLRYFLDTAGVLDERLGPLLFQLPPFFKKDVPRLRDFLALLPPDRRAAFEFRHASWFDDETYETLRAGRAALCAADTDESGEEGPPLLGMGDWGYLRLRRADYSDADLKGWAERVQTLPWREAFVFFKHEDAGKGAQFAERFQAAWGKGG
jgi:uncharacterized protein YecE (DUF72 family)